MSASTWILPTRIFIAGPLSRRSIAATLSREVTGHGVYGWPTQVVGHEELVVGKRTTTRVEAGNQAKEVLP